MYTTELCRKIYDCSKDVKQEISPACAFNFVDVLRRVHEEAQISTEQTPAHEPKLRPTTTDAAGLLQLEMSGDARSGLYNTRFIIASNVGYSAMECVVNVGFGPRVTRAAGCCATTAEQFEEPLAFELSAGGLALIRNFVDEKRLRGAFIVAKPIYPFCPEAGVPAGVRQQSA